MPSKKAPKYPGPLAEPFAARRRPSITDPIDDWDEMWAQQDLDELKKLALLLDHFGIPRQNRHRWLYLSLALARAHIRGFGTAVRRGRKLKWTPTLDAAAKLCIDRWIADHPAKHSINSAAAQVAKHEFWKPFIASSHASTEVLRQAYYRATQDEIDFLLELDATVPQDIPPSDRIYRVIGLLKPLAPSHVEKGT